MFHALEKDLQFLKNQEKALVLSRFFKTGKGEYGEGDIFLGITVPEQRKIARKYLDLPFKDIELLLGNKIHEYRLVGLLILVENFRKAYERKRKEIFDFYCKNTGKINNWDLVDLSADKIVGEYLYGKDTSLLHSFAVSQNFWEKRIAIVSTFAFIKRNSFDETFTIARALLQDEHDLIHKSVGWMLREVGKRNQQKEEEFLKKYYKQMPRTMLRYAIERFDEKKKRFYMKK